MQADIVIFNPDNIQDNATFDDPGKPSNGVEYLLVGGEVVVDSGEMTDAVPGKAFLRGLE
jgi:N-acyl-D-amino-acid deacylase